MNRSILIVICDFLLVSLLAFSTVDINKVAHPGSSSRLQMNVATNQAAQPDAARQDLAEAMRVALVEEQQNRTALLSDLAHAQAAITNQQSQLAARDQQLQVVRTEIQSRQAEIQQRDAQARQLQAQVQAAETNIANLNSQLRQTATESALSQEQRLVLEAEARKQAEKAAALQQDMDALRNANAQAQAQNHDLSSQLQKTQADRQAAAVQLAALQDEVSAQRQENSKLADGVKALATRSSELAQQIRDNTPLSPNTIFSDVQSNRVMASFTGVRQGFFGDATRSTQTATVLATDGTNIFGICHVQDTPIALASPGANWQDLTCSLTHNSAAVDAPSLSFYVIDPRVLLMPLPAATAQRLGARVYRLSSEPYKFEDAVVVGAKEGYYGECRFKIDVSTPEYFEMDRSTLRGLFGKFNPSSGDLVFSRQGELLGVMANNSYCVRIRGSTASAGFTLGTQISNENTGPTLSSLCSMVTGLPFKLQ